MKRGAVCDECNNRFSSFEGKALSNTIFVMERARHGVVSKKGRNAKGKIGELEIEGDTMFEKQKITIKGLSEENFTEFDRNTGMGILLVKSFDQNEVAMSRLLLKMALESIYTSRKEIYEKYDFKELKGYMTNSANTDWPFLTTSKEVKEFISVPRYLDKHILKLNKLELKYCEVNEQTLLFKFKFGAVSMIINLLNRSQQWINEYSDADSKSRLYPEHFRNKFGIKYDD
ncbi:hypothetical protein [Mucilaginibacter sp. NFX135]|uniref:hypothetical protein n=1 Tax=Mucilaginibacter sp. NFX135 TaxID=3402687 RepID=UPI003AFA5FDC